MYRIRFSLGKEGRQPPRIDCLEACNEQDDLLILYGTRPEDYSPIEALVSREDLARLLARLFGHTEAMANEDLAHAERTAREIAYERQVGLIEGEAVTPAGGSR